MPIQHHVRAAAAYNAAANSYDDPANSFWPRYGKRTIDRIELRAGKRVLDVCCGSGASALPAAEKVGSSGYVLGVDLSDRLLALARAKALQQRIYNVEFRIGDMLDLRLSSADFDAVVCTFGIFFAPDMTAAVQGLWKLVRPGGQLAITTWGPRFLEPMSGVFWESVRDVKPELYKGFNPWDRVCEPSALQEVLRSAGIEHAEVVAEAGMHEITPEAWWSAALGTGYRGTLEQLDAQGRERVRTATCGFIRDSNVSEAETNVVYALAKKA